MHEPKGVYPWMRKVVVPELFYIYDYNGASREQTDSKFISNTYGMRLGPPRLRQLRVTPGTISLLNSTYQCVFLSPCL